MADSVISVDKVKAFWHSQVHDEEKWNLNKATITDGKSFGIGLSQTVNKVKRRKGNWIAAVGKGVAKIDISLGYKELEAKKVARDDFTKLLRATALFAGSIILMRQYGDLMAI
uniref:Uncharacterized protein n=1 Tax=Solanum lycopersicum TaxID=4081 RepID=A0A3Q7GGH9_SOLLC